MLKKAETKFLFILKNTNAICYNKVTFKKIMLYTISRLFFETKLMRYAKMRLLFEKNNALIISKLLFKLLCHLCPVGSWI
jgi:hypothetical protein